MTVAMNLEQQILSQILKGLESMPDVDEHKVRTWVDFHCDQRGIEPDRETLVQLVMSERDTRMLQGEVIVEERSDHDPEWVHKKGLDYKWTYSDAYFSYLEDSQGWNPGVVKTMRDVTVRILGNLQNPEAEGTWSRRGLVVGHVQSGKTANYTGLIARAADAGYKLIIVVAGIHNSLRSQTQVRIEEGFIGRSSDENDRGGPVGVGRQGQFRTGGYPHPVILTTVHSDFRRSTAEISNWQLNDFSKPIVMVIKKHTSILQELHDWLRKLNADADNALIRDVPFLMIDDEADNASINTNKDGVDPTRTNSLIRQILALFSKSCYVGYTATPFANIFINADSYHDQIQDDLFPRDFIYALEAPSSYFGPNKVFLEEETREEALRYIDDAEDVLPIKHKIDFAFERLPQSLERAIDTFILARAIRDLRGQKNRHMSMLVNVSRFVGIQGQIGDLIEGYTKELLLTLKYHRNLPLEEAMAVSEIRTLEHVFSEEFANTGFSWPAVLANLGASLENIRFFVINNERKQKLEYGSWERDGLALNAIVIGGFSLSRGLTLEGLTVSYLYRNTMMYDTLMQMGRWFGYRPNYEDLCRIYMTEESANWYEHIAMATEELRQQLYRMAQDGLSPSRFGLYVHRHPKRLLITARNKMYSAEDLVIEQDFNGQLLETYILPTNVEVNYQNLLHIKKFWEHTLGSLEPVYTSAKRKDRQGSVTGFFRSGVPFEDVEQFVNGFKAIGSSGARLETGMEYASKIRDKNPDWDVLIISKGAGAVAADQEDYCIQPQRRNTASRRTDEMQGHVWHLSRERVAAPRDERLGLTSEQQEQAARLAEGKGSARSISDVYYREVRNRPLLMIHLLDIQNGKGRGENQQPGTHTDKNVPALGLSFPMSLDGTTVKVMANRVYMEQLNRSREDWLDEDEDLADD